MAAARLWAGAVASAAALSVSVATPARADEPELPPALDARADDVAIDARQNELQLKGNVRIDSMPFYLTSDELAVRRTRFGAEVTGKGQVAFLHASWTEWKNMFSFEIYGRMGKLEITGLGGLTTGQTLVVQAANGDGQTKRFDVKVRIDTPNEIEYFKHGGILQFVLRSQTARP